MKLFHISDVLSATTGRLVSCRNMDGLYDILNFLTGDNLFTHQLPRAMRECEPWLRIQFPSLMADSPGMSERLANMDRGLKACEQKREKIRGLKGCEKKGAVIDAWVEKLRVDLGLPQQLAVYEMDAAMHTRIDPIEEAMAMMGDDKVIRYDGRFVTEED